jgi:hypothetical protein
MINSTKQLNEIVRNISKENVISSVSQIATIIDLNSKAGVRFSVAANYPEAFASFVVDKFPEWETEFKNLEIESLVKQGKYEEAALKRDEMMKLKNEIHRQLRLEKYGTEDWFIEKSASEIFCCPTDIAVIDSLITECIV